jgi:hypothetical protein
VAVHATLVDAWRVVRSADHQVIRAVRHQADQRRRLPAAGFKASEKHELPEPEEPAMTAAIVTLNPATTVRTHAVRDRIRNAGHRALEYMGNGYAPPADMPDTHAWMYYAAMPMY